MGRFAGRRPDPTNGLARAVRGHLEPGEEVRAGIFAQRPGTFSAALEGAAGGATAGALDAPMSFRSDRGDADAVEWSEQLVRLGAPSDLARRTVHAAVVLTSDRLLVLRRSNLTRRVKGLVLALPVQTVETIEVSTRSSDLLIRCPDGFVHLELPQAHRFLPEVYRELPRLLREVQAARDSGDH